MAGNFEESLATLANLAPEDVNYDPKQFEDLREGGLFGEFRNYRLKKKLGAGGAGQTWLAEELVRGEASQLVVLKLLTKELRGNESAMQELRRTFDLTKDLNHSSICPILGRDADPVFGDFLVMKYADGGTLADWFHAQPNWENGLSLKRLLPIFQPLAEALDLAHRKGVVHRDVKPQNIMFMGRTPVLIDFSIAARVRPECVTADAVSFGPDPMACSTSGTPVYMAPEQMEGKAQNARTDQYALAMVFYEMLMGTLPFKSRNIAKIALEKLRFRPFDLRFPPHVNAAFSRALSFEPANRFASCSEFIEALTSPVSGTASFAGRPSAASGMKASSVSSASSEVSGGAASTVSSSSSTFSSASGAFSYQEEETVQRRRKRNADRKGWKTERKPRVSYVHTSAVPSDVQKANKEALGCVGGFCLFFFLLVLYLGNRHSIIGDEFWRPSCFMRNCPILCFGNYKIPDRVTEIGALYKFQDCSGLRSITIPGSIKTIPDGTFLRCRNLRSATLCEGVTGIGDYAFSGCTKLKKVSFPNSVMYIKIGAFKECRRLESIVLPDCLGGIPSHTFFDCAALESVVFPESLKCIGYRAFGGCESLKSIKIPDGVQQIEKEAFRDCVSIETVVLPAGVSVLEYGIFANCTKLKEIRVSEGNSSFKSVDGVLFSADGKTLLQYPAGKPLAEYTIPDGVESIAEMAFEGCTELRSVAIPESVTEIPESAFRNCVNLGSVKLPASVTKIGKSAFQGCGGLDSVKIPASVTEIGQSAFHGCVSLKSVEIPVSVTKIGDSAFRGCSALESVRIPKSETAIGSDAFKDCGKLTIFGEKNSEVKRYSRQNVIQFQEIE